MSCIVGTESIPGLKRDWRLKSVGYVSWPGHHLQGEPQRVGPGCSDQGVPAIRTRLTRKRDGSRQERGLRDPFCRRAATLSRRGASPDRIPAASQHGRLQRFLHSSGTAYLVVEYVDGQPLSQVLRERESAGQPFTESDLLAIATPKCDCTGAPARIAGRRSWRGHRRVWSTARRSGV